MSSNWTVTGPWQSECIYAMNMQSGSANKPRRNRRRNGRRNKTSKLGHFEVTNINSSPWRNIVFTLQIESTIGAWGRLNSDALVQGLYSHLGFTPTSTSYLEVRYQKVEARRQEAGTALSMRLYRVEATHPTVEGTVAVVKAVESWSVNSISFPRCVLSWDSVSRLTPLTAKETQSVLALYSHLGTVKTVLLVLQVLYRHAATPFEHEPTFANVIVSEPEVEGECSTSFERLSLE